METNGCCLQEELKTSEKLLDESKTLHAEVHGTLTNNLLKKKAELDGRMSNLATPENRYQLMYQDPKQQVISQVYICIGSSSGLAIVADAF